MSEENRKKAVERMRKFNEEKKRSRDVVQIPEFAVDSH